MRYAKKQTVVAPPSRSARLPIYSIPSPRNRTAYCSFPSSLWAAFIKYQGELRRLSKHDPAEYLSASVPLSKYINEAAPRAFSPPEKIFFPVPKCTGRPILALQPHADDLMLSCGGTLLAMRRPVVVATIFGDSKNIHPAVPLRKSLHRDEISRLRLRENRAALSSLGASFLDVHLREARWPATPPQANRINEIAALLESIIAKYSGHELLAPACVSCHPDHFLIHHAAKSCGCGWFWDDVDFYPNYGRLAEDRELFLANEGRRLTIGYHDITQVAMLKFSALTLFGSQFFSSQSMYGPLRYNWAVAQAGIRSGALRSTTRFSERMYTARTAN